MEVEKPKWENERILFCLQTSKFAVANVIKHIRKGGNLNSLNKDGNTLLHCIALRPSCNWSAVKEIFKAKVDVNARDLKGRTPLHRAVKYPDDNFRFVSTILQYGANVNVKDAKGNTPLHIAAKVSCEYSIVKILVDAGARLNSRNNDGCTPLHVAMMERKPFAIQELVKCGPDVNIRDTNGSLPIHYLLRSKLITIPLMDMIADLGGYFNDRDEFGNTPLHVAVRQRPLQTTEYIEKLIYLGANKHTIDARGKVPEKYLPKKEDISSLVFDPDILDLQDERLFRRSNVTLNGLLSNPHCTLLQVQQVLETVGMVDRETYVGYSGPLHYAAKNPSCNVEIINLLIEYESPINAVDLKGNTALHFATERVPLDVSVIEALLKSGAKLGYRNKKGENALHYVLRNNTRARQMKLACAKLLVRHAIIQNEFLSSGFGAVWDYAFPEAASYVKDCLSERKMLKADKVSNCRSTLFDLVVSQGLIFEKDLKNVFWALANNYFPIFCDFIINKMDKKFVVGEVLTTEIYMIDEKSTTPKKIALKTDCVRNLTFYLSKLDLLNLVIAVR